MNKILILFAFLFFAEYSLMSRGEDVKVKMIDFSKAVVFELPSQGPSTSDVLSEYCRSLSSVMEPDWSRTEDVAVIAVGTKRNGLAWTGPFQKKLADGKGMEGAEGYRIEVDPSIPAVIVVGNDERGALYGVGRLLREFRFQGDKVLLPSDFHEASAPENDATRPSTRLSS